jgi:hypothetical protein
VEVQTYNNDRRRGTTHFFYEKWLTLKEASQQHRVVIKDLCSCLRLPQSFTGFLQILYKFVARVQFEKLFCVIVALDSKRGFPFTRTSNSSSSSIT